jgi:sortase A
LYPEAANWFNVRAQQAELAAFHEAIGSLTEAQTDEMLVRAELHNEMLARAEEHNEMLARGIAPAEYYEQLRVGGTDAMAQINVPSIDLAIAVFHGVSHQVLDRAAGHHPATSLPVGGNNTHAVITAHTGLPNARLFNRLIDVELGDIVIVRVPGRILYYEVIRYTIVLAGDYHDHLLIEPNDDLLTLFTCTPYSINTHRLLVTARRIDNPEEAGVADIVPDPVDAGFPMWAAILSGAFLASIGSGRLIFGPSKKKAAKQAASNDLATTYIPRHMAQPLEGK